jgi:pilus assembly protein CpaE
VVETHPIRTLVSLDNGTDEMAVRAALPEDSSIQLVGLLRGTRESWATLQETPTDLLVIACSGYSERVLSFITSAVREHPKLPVVVLVQSSPEGFLNRLFEAGADDVIRLPESPERVKFMIQKVVARRRALAATGGGDEHPPMICVLGPKGGVGKTVTVTNLAMALGQAGKKVAAVDLDVQFGDLALCMGVPPETTIYDLATSPGSLDAGKLEAYLVTHEESGVRVLVAPTRPDQASRITVEFLREVYAILRETHDFVLVDCAPGFTPEVIAAIDSSSHVMIMSMLDTLSLKNARLGLETLELMGYDQANVKFVLNRALTRVGITDDDVKAIAGRAPDFQIPSDIEIARSVNEGRPIVLSRPKSDSAEAFVKLAQVFAGPLETESQQEELAPQPRRRLLPRRT